MVGWAQVVLDHKAGWSVAGGAMGRSDGFGPVRGVRRLPSSYASSRVAAVAPRPHGAGRRGGALRPVRQSEVIGPGWAQTASTDHSKPAADFPVRQLQGFDQVLHRWKGFAHRVWDDCERVSELVS